MYNKGDRIKCIKAPNQYFSVGKTYQIILVDNDKCWVRCDDGEFRAFSTKQKEIFGNFFKDVLDWHVGDKIVCYKDGSTSPSLKIGNEYTIVAITDKHVRVSYGGPWLDKGRFRNLRIERKMKLRRINNEAEE